MRSGLTARPWGWWGLWLPLLLAGCAGEGGGLGNAGMRPSAKVTAEQEVGPAPTGQPGTVYVTDFEVELPPDAQTGESRGLLGQPVGPAGRILNRLRHDPGSPEERAEKLVMLMSTSLVNDLRKAGVPAYRVPLYAPRPSQGWLLRGVVTNLDEGNRIRRAVIGFGAGATELEVYVGLIDLAQGGDAPFYTIDTSADSGKMPGAVITMNPYVAAAKYVMSRNASERDVEHTASKIAEEVMKRLRATP